MVSTHDYTTTESLNVSDSVSYQIQTYLADQHIWSAAMYARKCAEIERSYTPGSMVYESEEFDDLYREYKAHTISAVFSAVAFLDAAINRIRADATDYVKSHEKSHDTSTPEYAIWRRMLQGVKRKQTKSDLREHQVLTKFDNALTAARNKQPNRNKFPYEAIDLFTTFHDVYLLINLRGAFTHYEPKWRAVLSENILVEKVDEAELDALRYDPIQQKPKFPLNQLLPVGPTYAFFPEKCFGHGCAKWAVNAAIQFAEEFYQEMNKVMPTPCLPDNIRSRLKTEP